jgi:hypothetical protein
MITVGGALRAQDQAPPRRDPAIEFLQAEAASVAAEFQAAC